ncbi:MAG TPA: FAD-dependent thymidylate synthase [Anaerolineales bacterium]|nr:FAD-dependent thymidylate synthase [Anaerolineales bacterium]
MPDRRIYLLSPRELSPETIAVAFAKTSRSPESFGEIAAGLSDEQSARFHEKWVVGYGHASVAEHAVLHLAMEGISRLAVECVESNRLASYTEKSTRYQKWDADAFHVPAELEGHALKAEYLRVCRVLFETYLTALDPVKKVVAERTTRRDQETDEALDRRIRSQYVDACRFLLPAASLANVGMTANARVLEHAIRKMLSHELQEVRDIGEQVKAVARLEVPTLVKYADAVPYNMDLGRDLNLAVRTIPGEKHTISEISCTLVGYDEGGENRVLAAALFQHSGGSFADSLQHVNGLDAAGREELARVLLGKLAEHDIPARELEYCVYVFDLVMDQGAYAEFKRHRMMSQTPQLLTTRLGYSTPRLMADAGLQTAYDTAMHAASDCFEQLVSISPQVAQYVVPNGSHRRVLAQFNLREAFAFCELRSAPNAHFSIRLVAERVAEEIRRVHPLLSRFMRLPAETPSQVVERHFASPGSRDK